VIAADRLTQCSQTEYILCKFCVINRVVNTGTWISATSLWCVSYLTSNNLESCTKYNGRLIGSSISSVDWSHVQWHKGRSLFDDDYFGNDTRYGLNYNGIPFDLSNGAIGWRCGLVVTRWPRSTYSCATSLPVSIRMGDRLWTVSRYVTSQLGRLSLLPSVGR